MVHIDEANKIFEIKGTGDEILNDFIDLGLALVDGLEKGGMDSDEIQQTLFLALFAMTLSDEELLSMESTGRKPKIMKGMLS